MRKSIVVLMVLLIVMMLPIEAVLAQEESKSYWTEIPMDFTLRENQFQMVDDTVYMQYCFMVAAHITESMSISKLEEYMKDTHIYYIERKKSSAENGDSITEYLFLPTLTLRFVNDPIERASLVLTCLEHPTACVEVPISTYYTEGNMAVGLLGIYDAFAAQYGVDWRNQKISGSEKTAWLDMLGVSECFGKKHSLAHRVQSVLFQYAAQTTLACPGMTMGQVQALLQLFPTAYGTQSIIENADAIFLDIGQRGLFAESELWLSYTFVNDKLCQVVLMMLPPMCGDMFGSPLVYDTNARNPEKNYSIGEYAPSIMIQLDQTWSANELGITVP